MSRRSKDPSAAPAPPEVLDDLPSWMPGDADGWMGVEVTGELTGYSGKGAEVSGSRLVDVRLTAAVLDRALFTDVTVIDAELSAASLHRATLSRVSFLRCRMRGVVLAAATLRDVTFTDCLLDEANLREMEGSSVRFEGCQFVGADFGRAKLRRSAIFDSDLTDAAFGGADLEGVRLHGSRLDGVRGAEGLAGAVIESSQVIPLAVPLLAASKITVEDDREAGA